MDDVPKWSEDGLFVLGDNVTLYVHQVKVAIAPQTFDVNVEPFLLGLDVAYCFVWIHFFCVLLFIRTTDNCCLREQAVSGGGENVLGRRRGV